MTEVRKINDRFAVALGPPSEEDLQQIAADGYKAVVNLRCHEEDDQPLKPAEEGEKAHQLGMEYRHIPVSVAAIDESLVDNFRASVQAIPGPIYVHCALGKRAGAFTMMHLAVEAGLSGQQTLEQAKTMGFECANETLAAFVRSYVDRHRS